MPDVRRPRHLPVICQPTPFEMRSTRALPLALGIGVALTAIGLGLVSFSRAFFLLLPGLFVVFALGVQDRALAVGMGALLNVAIVSTAPFLLLRRPRCSCAPGLAAIPSTLPQSVSALPNGPDDSLLYRCDSCGSIWRVTSVGPEGPEALTCEASARELL